MNAWVDSIEGHEVIVHRDEIMPLSALLPGPKKLHFEHALCEYFGEVKVAPATPKVSLRAVDTCPDPPPPPCSLREQEVGACSSGSVQEGGVIVVIAMTLIAIVGFLV